eukprot:TRINITY_DN936_c3_g1_i1.p1 TRINITY_DN936_c3_g1~~TRINITY_DN936_c3_g1_i1.p1  ORF type:complete len:264 (+),score=47.20 TRINITY_DN936_c3_g1_i1:72-794(+)
MGTCGSCERAFYCQEPRKRRSRRRNFSGSGKSPSSSLESDRTDRTDRSNKAPNKAAVVPKAGNRPQVPMLELPAMTPPPQKLVPAAKPNTNTNTNTGMFLDVCQYHNDGATEVYEKSSYISTDPSQMEESSSMYTSTSCSSSSLSIVSHHSGGTVPMSPDALTQHCASPCASLMSPGRMVSDTESESDCSSLDAYNAIYPKGPNEGVGTTAVTLQVADNASVEAETEAPNDSESEGIVDI